MTKPDDPTTDPVLQRRVRGYIRARLPTEDAEDVIQDAWLRILRDWPRYDPEKGPVWPFCKYRCMDAIKEYYRRRPPASDSDDNIPDAAPPPRSPDAYERLLEVTFAAPTVLHQLLAFAYIDLLEWKPAEIVAEIADATLEDLGNRFVVDYASHFPHHRDVVLQFLHPLTERLRGERDPLSDAFKHPNDPKRCAQEITRWRYSVCRRVRSDLFFLSALEDLLTSPRPRHEQIVYGLVVLLRWKPQVLAEQHLSESLKSLAERFEDGCGTRRPHLRGVLRRIFRPLHRDPALTGRSLCDVVPEGQNLLDTIVLWTTPAEGIQP